MLNNNLEVDDNCVSPSVYVFDAAQVYLYEAIEDSYRNYSHLRFHNLLQVRGKYAW